MTLNADVAATDRPPRATVLVTDAGKGSALAIIRSLARRGLRVIAADCDPRGAGLRSRYCAARVSYPPPASDPNATVEALLDYGRAFDVDLVIPVTDDVILPLSAARKRFAPHCRLAVADADALAVTSDKEATLALAGRLGIPTPRTVLARDTAEAVAGARFGWPVVVKPQTSRSYHDGTIEGFHVGYADGPQTLAGMVDELAGRCAVLIQEYCPGEGHGVELLLDRGHVLAAFQHRRLHEVPVTGGASSLRESVPLDPDLFAWSSRLMGALEWTGLAMVEFKKGPAGAFLMEVNGRVWGSLPLAVRSGMDFPAKLADLYLRPPSAPPGNPDTDYAVGVRSRNLELEVVWIGSVLAGRRRHPFLQTPARREALSAALRLVAPSDGYDILSVHDVRPGLAELSRIARKLRAKAVARVG